MAGSFFNKNSIVSYVNAGSRPLMLLDPTGNGVTAERAGQWAEEKLQKYAITQSKKYNTEYFIAHINNWEGISISYSVGVG